MGKRDEPTGINRLESGDALVAENLTGEYIAPQTPEGTTTNGAIDAWLKFIAKYAINAYNIEEGFNFTGETVTTGQVKYDANDHAGYLQSKLVEGDGVSFTVSTGSNKAITISLDISESTSTAQSLLKNSTTLKKLASTSGITIASDTEELTITLDQSYFDSVFLKLDGVNAMSADLDIGNNSIKNITNIIGNALGSVSGFINNTITGMFKTTSTLFNSIETAGGVRFEGGSWDDDNLDPTMLTGTGTLPISRTWAATGCSVAGFRGNGTDEVELIREIPHGAKTNIGAGTSVIMSFHGHVATEDAAIGNMRFGLEYFFEKEGVAVTTSTIIYVTVATSGTAWAKNSFEFPDIVVPNELGAQGHYRFFRLGADVLDTYGGYALVSTIGYHYDSNATGSDQITTKT